jgi:hypothetical protein
MVHGISRAKPVRCAVVSQSAVRLLGQPAGELPASDLRAAGAETAYGRARAIRKSMLGMPIGCVDA